MARTDRIVVAAVGAALILAAAAAWVLVAPSAPEEPLDGAALLLPSIGATATPAIEAGASQSAEIFVDVQGGVAQPGVRQLPAGSRVADAISAAGGYGADADLDAATATINLARPLTDGEQVRVPRIGDAAVAAASSAGASTGGGGTGATGAGGPVNLNTATPEELEALPGIGPVTVQKIVAARQERPFASLDDAVQRGVLNRGQLEDIQGLATAG